MFTAGCPAVRGGDTHYQPYLTAAAPWAGRRAADGRSTLPTLPYRSFFQTCGRACHRGSDPGRLSGLPSACYQGILCQLCLGRHSLSTLPHCCFCLGGQEGGGWRSTVPTLPYHSFFPDVRAGMPRQTLIQGVCRAGLQHVTEADCVNCVC